MGTAAAEEEIEVGLLKRKLPFAVGVVIALSIAAAAQNVPELKQVTLYARIHYQDWSRAAINFETGERGSSYKGLPDFDLTFGSMAINYDCNWFVVTNTRSQIVTLGKKKWTDFKQTPSFPVSKTLKPLPLKDPPMTVDASGDSKSISPYQQHALVKADHMYLMKIVRDGKKSYIMFRVDKLVSQDNCVIAWKKVAPPPDDLEK